MKYIVDRIENGIAILEIFDSSEMIEVDVNLLPSDIHDGSIIYYESGVYSLDLDEEEIRRKKIEDRFKRLRNE